MARPKVQCSGFITICPACGVQHQEGCEVTTCPSCGAELNRCTRSAVYQFHYCHQHGGPRPTMGIFGKESMSRFPIVKLSEKYDRMQKSGRLLSNRAAIEVVRTRIQQLAERIDMNHAPDRLATLGKLWADYDCKVAKLEPNVSIFVPFKDIRVQEDCHLAICHSIAGDLANGKAEGSV